MVSVRSQLAHYPDAQATVDPSLGRVTALLEAALGELHIFLGTFNPPDFARRKLREVLEGLVAQHEALTGDSITFAASPLPAGSLSVACAACVKARRSSAASCTSRASRAAARA